MLDSYFWKCFDLKVESVWLRTRFHLVLNAVLLVGLPMDNGIVTGVKLIHLRLPQKVPHQRVSIKR